MTTISRQRQSQTIRCRICSRQSVDQYTHLRYPTAQHLELCYNTSMRKCFLESDMVQKSRNETNDTAKGIGIVLVFMGHLLVAPVIRLYHVTIAIAAHQGQTYRPLSAAKTHDRFIGQLAGHWPTCLLELGYCVMFAPYLTKTSNILFQ